MQSRAIAPSPSVAPKKTHAPRTTRLPAGRHQPRPSAPSAASNQTPPPEPQHPDHQKQSIQERLAAYGLSGVASYGLFNTLYYVVSFFVVLFTLPKPSIDSFAVALQHVLKLLAVVWAGSQVTKLPRAACALGCAPLMDTLLEWLRTTLRLKGKREAFLYVLVPFCWLLFFSLLAISVLFLRY
jgi:hypothetical protein